MSVQISWCGSGCLILCNKGDRWILFDKPLHWPDDNLEPSETAVVTFDEIAFAGPTEDLERIDKTHWKGQDWNTFLPAENLGWMVFPHATDASSQLVRQSTVGESVEGVEHLTSSQFQFLAKTGDGELAWSAVDEPFNDLFSNGCHWLPSCVLRRGTETVTRLVVVTTFGNQMQLFARFRRRA